MTDWKSIYIETKKYPFSEQLRANKYLKEGLDFQISEDGEVYFSGKALLSEVACLRHFAIEESEKVKELKKLNKSLLRKLKGVRKRRKAEIWHYETVLQYADKAVKDSASRETELNKENYRLKKELAYINKEGISDFSSLISNAQRFREALVTICAIYEINGAEWRFDKRLYEVAKKALEGKDD